MNDKTPVEPFLWEFLLGFLFSQIRLSLDAFWSLSMPEVSALLSHHTQKISPHLSLINRDTLGDLEIQEKSLGHALTSAFKSSIVGGKDLSSVMSKLALSLSNMVLNKALAPLEKSFSSGLDGLMGGLLGGAKSGSSSPLKITPFANGGVVSNPTYFPMGGVSSVSLMGEAGSEAILPLTRGSDGALGVASASVGSSAVNITFNISTPNVEGFARSEAQVSAMLARAVGRGRRGL